MWQRFQLNTKRGPPDSGPLSQAVDAGVLRSPDFRQELFHLAVQTFGLFIHDTGG